MHFHNSLHEVAHGNPAYDRLFKVRPVLIYVRSKLETNFTPTKNIAVDEGIPCSTKILSEFYFADWRCFVVCRNKFLRVEMTEISAGN